MSMTIEKAIEEIRFNMSHIRLGARAARRVKEAKEMAINALEEIQQYRAIGTVEEFRELKEKETANPIKGRKFVEAICPHCESEIFDTYWAFGGIHYCSDCGSAIDWSEGKG